MADKTKIEWADATWNFITGCSVVSPGCTNCYAMRLAGTRLKHHWSRASLTTLTKAGPVWNGKVSFNHKWLRQPLQWTRPRRIFPCAHSDLFHEHVPYEWIDLGFAVMATARQHTYQVLTKRSGRMRAYLSDPETPHRVMDAAIKLQHGPETRAADPDDTPPWPLPNVWAGFSAEDQERFDERWPDMEPLARDGWLTWCSAEPLLGPIDASAALALLRWLVAGGESGPRPCHPDWVRNLRDQCVNAGVPFHFKQWGDWLPGEVYSVGDHGGFARHQDGTDNAHVGFQDHWWSGDAFGGVISTRVGKKAAGRLLDGRTWDEYPEAA